MEKVTLQSLSRLSQGMVWQFWVVAGGLAAAQCARLGWPFELASHFLGHALIALAALAPALLIAGRWRYAVAALGLAILVLVQMRTPLEDPWRFGPLAGAPFVRVVQYNTATQTKNEAQVEPWLRTHCTEHDVVVIQEATARTVDMAESLRADCYPHQVQAPRPHAFGMVVLSRHPLTEIQEIPISGPRFDTFMLRVQVTLPGEPLTLYSGYKASQPDRQVTLPSEPLTLYALHTVPPMGRSLQAQRDAELAAAARTIAADAAPRTVFVGDWNTTPYSPAFWDLLSASGLLHQAGGILQNPTWPAWLPHFMHLPIDHVLHSPDLVILERTVGPALGSDHHALIVTLGLKET
ncbi:MAG TPA: hypothetical protein DDX54_04030 [Rhodospirillaceae bacterium]|jgi:endonuclease/exonuclease/phosphatase (EEP) superfamily protein YafD|nr:endonuclease/exonuclease/phosphatase family protein [Alphaproteobacteria bacterium]HBH26553.1 hypothetical protein [Rhodospirillaceae bacterium]